MIDAVIFDLDGVLIESEETWSHVRATFVARYGGHWTEQDQRNVMGDNTRQWAAYIQRIFHVPLSEEAIARAVTEAMVAAYRQQLDLLPGAAAAVARMRARFPLAVASSSPRALIVEALHLSALGDAFAAIVSSDDVAHGKPAPDVYVRAAAVLEVDPRACAAVEDSSNGIRAALAAGMVTIAIPNRTFPPPPDVRESAHAVLADLDALTVARVEQLGAQR